MEHSRNFKERDDVRVVSIERVDSGFACGDCMYDVVVDAYGEIERYYDVLSKTDYRNFRDKLMMRMNRINIDNEAEAEEMLREANYIGA